MTSSKPCRCCGLETALFGPPRMFNGLPAAAIVCDLCARHQGSHQSELRKRDRDHVEMWREDKREAVTALVERHERTVAGLQETIRELQTTLDERPVQVVYQNLDQEEVDQAHQHARRAYRSRDRAFLDLTRIHLLHFELSAGRCRCGKPLDRCEEAAIVDTAKALRGREHHHAERRRQGKPHLLPHGHPGIVDARWDPDDDTAAEFDDYVGGHERPRR